MNLPYVKRLAAFSVIAFFIVSCAKVPITGRKQLHLLPESQMAAMALTEYRNFLSQNKLSADANNTAMVKRIGDRMSKAVTTYLQSHNYGKRVAGYNWEFNLVEDKNINAWCMPGGKVVVYTGLLPVTQNETGLAVVMGHEIAHAIAQHGNERMSQGLALYMGGVALGVATSSKTDTTRMIFNTAYGVSASLGELAFSRNHESEADKLGLVFMALSGYSPSEAIPFWNRMASMSGSSIVPFFLRTHPTDDKRIRDIQAFLPEAMKYYVKAK
jgi:predicted Zn-dependent protease